MRRRGRDADPASYVAMVAGARIGAASGMHGGAGAIHSRTSTGTSGSYV